VKQSVGEQKHFIRRLTDKVVEGAKKKKSCSLRAFAPWRLCVRLFVLSKLLSGEGRKDGSLSAESCVLAKGKTGTKLPEIGQWLAEIGHNPFPSSGMQRTPARTRTKNR
jgi:hypothetical protein